MVESHPSPVVASPHCRWPLKKCMYNEIMVLYYVDDGRRLTDNWSAFPAHDFSWQFTVRLRFDYVNQTIKKIKKLNPTHLCCSPRTIGCKRHLRLTKKRKEKETAVSPKSRQQAHTQDSGAPAAAPRLPNKRTHTQARTQYITVTVPWHCTMPANRQYTCQRNDSPVYDCQQLL